MLLKGNPNELWRQIKAVSKNKLCQLAPSEKNKAQQTSKQYATSTYTVSATTKQWARESRCLWFWTNSCEMASLQHCQRIIMIKKSDDTYALMSCECQSINVWLNAAERFFEFYAMSDVLEFTKIWASFLRSVFTTVYRESQADDVFTGQIRWLHHLMGKGV